MACICAAGAVFGILKTPPESRTAEKEISAELTFINLPAGLTTATPPVKFIRARVSGPAEQVESLTNARLTYRLNLAASTPGHQIFTLSAKHFGLPETIRVTDVEPETIALKIKPSDQKKLPVYIALAGKPAAGFTVIDAFAVPGTVTVSGPENLLAGMDRVMTKPIAIEGIAESIRKETALDLPGGVKAAVIEKALVADIRIAAKMGRRTLTEIPVSARGSDHPAILSPPLIALEIEGPANMLAKLDHTGDINVFVDLDGLKPGVYVRRASISLPLGITLIKANPELFTVTVGQPSRDG